MHAARPDPLSVFLDSMPERYRQQPYDGAAVREHAAIVRRRAGASVHAEIWRRLPRGGAVVCVVAEDQPGLLSFISAALVAHGLDVESAQAYTRQAHAEAVDFFWVRRVGAVTAPVLDAEMGRIAGVLRDLVSRARTIEDVAAGIHPGRARAEGGATNVRFDLTPASGLAVLTVETYDRPGLLLAIARALHRARVQIVASEATTTDGRVVDRFTLVELDGAPLRPGRRGVLQVEVLAAIDSLAR